MLIFSILGQRFLPFSLFKSVNQDLKRLSVRHYMQLNVKVILHGRQVHFQHSYSLLELAFSPKKPRSALNQTLSLYFKCYFCALYKDRNIQELLFTNTNLFIRIHAFSGRFNHVTTRSCFSVVAVRRLLPTRKV